MLAPMQKEEVAQHIPSLIYASLKAMLSKLFPAAVLGAVGAQAVWQPAAGDPFQIILSTGIDVSGTIQPSNVTIFDIDMYNNAGDDGTDATVVKALQKQKHKVICYFSAGSYEPDRPDSDQFQAADKGKELVGWPGEFWLNTKSSNVRKIMVNRIKNAATLGCDAIDPDNVDAYVRDSLQLVISCTPQADKDIQDNDNGFGLTAADAVNFTTFLATTAQQYNLAIGLKNAGKIVTNVSSIMQFSVQEQCVATAPGECKNFVPFITAGKPVFHIEYPPKYPTIPSGDFTQFCHGNTTASPKDPDISQFSTVMKSEDLDGTVHYCNGFVSSTTLAS
jgi:hypothetical protein